LEEFSSLHRAFLGSFFFAVFLPGNSFFPFSVVGVMHRPPLSFSLADSSSPSRDESSILHDSIFVSFSVPPQAVSETQISFWLFQSLSLLLCLPFPPPAAFSVSLTLFLARFVPKGEMF